MCNEVISAILKFLCVTSNSSTDEVVLTTKYIQSLRICFCCQESIIHYILTFWSGNSDLLYSFFSIFCRSCQIQCFLHTVAAILRWSIHLSHIFASNHNKIFPLFGIAVCDSVQKALDLTNPARNRIKLSIIDLSFRQKA